MAKVAHVGASQPLTFDDHMRAFLAGQMLGSHIQPDGPQSDIIQLDNGRDFLAETKQYEVVVLHSIFHTNMTERVEGAHQSPLHSIDAWRRRLEQSGAQAIVVWELLPATLSGWNLGKLQGYKIEHRDYRVTVYLKR